MADVVAQPHVHEERVSAEVILGGALAETITGAGVVVISIIGLAGFMPTTMMSLAAIGLGMSFLFEGGAVVTRLSNLLSEVTEGRFDIAELGGGLTVEFIAGFGGITLGILSLIGVAPTILIPIAAIAFGGALVIGSGVKARVNHLMITNHTEDSLARKIAREAVLAVSGVEILIGMGAVALGILGIIGIFPMVLSLVANLSVGSMVLLVGTALGGRMLSLFRR
jgi:hypothetical protein